MPHLPPVDVTGGSVIIELPIEKVNSKGEVVQPLFYKEEMVTKAYRKGDDNRALLETNKAALQTYSKGISRYNVQQYSAVDAKAQIYLIEIHGLDGDETFEFRPKSGKCSVRIYYALEDELPVSRKVQWRERTGREQKK